MTTKIRMVALAAACCAISHIGLAAVEFPASSGPVVPGEWNTHFYAGKQYAEANQIPMVIFWANPGCSYCEKLEKAVQYDDFVAWMKASGYVFVFAYGTGARENADAKKFVESGTGGKYPYVGVYYNTNGGWKQKNFSGRSTTMPSTKGSGLQQKLLNSIESIISSGAGQGTNPGNGGTGGTGTDEISSGWQHARTIGLAAESSGRYLATVSAKLGKANKSKKTASVTLTVQPFGGKKFRITGKVPANETPFTLSKSGYTVVMSVSDSGNVQGTVSGKGYDLTLVPANFGGATAVNCFTIENPPAIYNNKPVLAEFLGNVPFSTSGTKWSFPKAGKVSWKDGTFVNTNPANPCGVKLTYKSSAGSFSGKFMVYAQTGEKKVKKITAKVSGFVINGIGYGVATANGLPDMYVGVVAEVTPHAE